MEHKPDCALNIICTTVHKGGQTCLYKGCDCGAEGIPPNNMQETKGCCGNCKPNPKGGLQICVNNHCPCHNSSDRNREAAEALVDLAAESRKQGANEFKQKVLEALPKTGDVHLRLKIINIISNLEV